MPVRQPADTAAAPPAAPAARRPALATPRWARWIAALFVATLAIVPFWPARHFELVWDDPFLMDQLEAKTRAGGMARVLGSEFRLLPDQPTGYFRPVTVWTMVLDARSGWGDAPAAQVRRAARRLHVTNLLLHAACSVLVLLLLEQLLGWGWPAVLGSALFAVHPTHVEPAVFVSARTDSLACLFSLLSVLAWLAARRRSVAGRRRAVLWAAGAGTALLAALAKESAMMLPAALAAWNAILPPGEPHPRDERAGSRWGWLPAWVAAIAAALLLRLVVAHVGLGARTDASGPSGFAALVRVGLPALLLYLRLWVFPWPLNAYYTPDQLAATVRTALAVAALAALTAAAIRRARGRASVAGWALALAFLVPVLHLLPLQGAAAAERFLYLPSVGLTVVLAAALAACETMSGAPTARILMGAATLAGVAASAAGARGWHDNRSLFTRMVATSPASPVAHHGLATVYAEQGLQLKAIEHYQRALELKPDHIGALNGLAVAHIQMKEYEAARPPLRLALRLHPELPDAYTNMGVSYAMQDSHTVAIPFFVQAARLSPRSPRARFNLGLALHEAGDHQGAQAELEVLAKLDPRMAQRLRDQMAGRSPAAPAAP